jgi:hypothetical protein
MDPLVKIISYILIKQNVYKLKYRRRYSFFVMFLLQCGSKICGDESFKLAAIQHQKSKNSTCGPLVEKHWSRQSTSKGPNLNAAFNMLTFYKGRGIQLNCASELLEFNKKMCYVCLEIFSSAGHPNCILS